MSARDGYPHDGAAGHVTPLEQLLAAMFSIAFGFGLAAWFLAIVGLFRPGPVVILGTAAAYTIHAVWKAPAEGELPSRWTRMETIALLLAGTAVASGIWFGGLGILADGPGPSNLLTAMHLSDGGGIVIPADVAAVPVPDGFESIDGGVVTAAPGAYAALLGVAALAGDSAVATVTPVLAGMFVLAMYVLVSRVVAPGAGLVTAAALALTPLTVLAGRDARAAVFAGFFLLTGLWAFDRAAAGASPSRGAIAAGLVGTGAVATGEPVLYLAALGLVITIEAGTRATSWVQRRVAGRFAVAAAAGATVPVLISLADAWRRETLASWAGGGWYIAAAAAVVAIVVWRLGPLRIDRRWGRAAVIAASLLTVAGLSYGLLVRPVGTDVLAEGSAASWTLRWLWWYLGPVALLLGGVGLPALFAVGSGPGAVARRSVAVMGGVAGAVLLMNPGGGIDQPGAAYVFLPMVVPALLVATARVLHLLFVDADRYIRQTVALVLGAGLLAGAAYYSLPVWNAPVQDGAAPGVDAICTVVPEDAPLAVLGDTFGVELAPALAVRCERPVIMIADAGTVPAGSSLITSRAPGAPASAATVAVARIVPGRTAPPEAFEEIVVPVFLFTGP